MRPDELKALLTSMRAGATSVDDAFEKLRLLPVDDIGFARLDTHREIRQGFPEAIYAEGKTPDQVVEIARRLRAGTTSAVLATRVAEETAVLLRKEFPEASHNELGRVVTVRRATRRISGTVALVTAGTSDLPVAEEAAATLDAVGVDAVRLNDVGVAGLHRLLAEQATLRAAHVVIVVAGMEGALPSIVGGLTPAPVIAVPTSVGYGASFDGLAALLGMLNSCAAGVAVMNIDNGFGAALFALRTMRSEP